MIDREYGVHPPTASATFELSADAMAVRRAFEESFMTDGFGPDPHQIAKGLGLSSAAMSAALTQLQQAVQVMFVPGTETVVKMPPFSYVPTRHTVSVGDARRWYAGCAGEACAFSKLFRGRTVIVDSRCPHCDDPVQINVKEGVVLRSEPDEAVIHVGIHPLHSSLDWITTCDSINFFPAASHVEQWEDMVPSRRGVCFPVALGPPWVDAVASSRYWDYERGPEVVNREGVEKMIGWFESHGIDTRPWTMAENVS